MDASMDASSLFVELFRKTKYEDLPAEVVEAAKMQILDYIGVALAGYFKAGAREVRELAVEWGGAPQSTVLGWGGKLPAPNAAQVNATMAHSLDYDDVHEAAVMHPGVISIPTALSMAEYRGGLSGKELITAVALGGDMISRMGLATHPGQNIHPFGWHFTAVNGYMASAAVAGKVLGLSEDEMLCAIGIAYHQASGNGQAVKDAALTKRLGPGFSVRGGVMSAMLAQRGVTGARNTFEGVNGYYKVYHGNDYSREILLGGLGERYETVNVSIKPYSCCRGVHPSIDAALSIVREYGVKPDDIENVVIWCGEGTLGLLGEPLEVKAKPRTVVDAQFSIAWGAAAALTYGEVSLKHYTDDAIHDPAILATAAKIRTENDPALDAGGLEPARVVVTTKTGKTYQHQANAATGSPERPLTFDECERKFRDCVTSGERRLSAENIEKIAGNARKLEAESDIRDFIAMAIWE